ncbi:MAG TPA: hypothetical protein VGC64_01655 [Pyrinomonadaceae bacterium]
MSNEEKSVNDKIQEIMIAIEAEKNNGGPMPVADELKQKGVDAIMGGAQDWLEYMKLFADGPEALARLIPTDGTEYDPEKRQARAYLVANSVCAPGTAGALADNVFDMLDYALPSPAEPAPAEPAPGDPPPSAPGGSNP